MLKSGYSLFIREFPDFLFVLCLSISTIKVNKQCKYKYKLNSYEILYNYRIM